MATAAVLRSILRRSRPSQLLHLPRALSHPLPPLHSPTLASLDAFRTRAFSTHSFNDRESEIESFGIDSPVHSEILKAVADSAGAGGEDSPVFPIRAVISILESYHDLTGFPWWITIVSSTFALRIVMLFPLVFTLHKLKRIAEFAPKLPPPFPPPFSGKSYMRQMSCFEEKRKAIGCPSYAGPLVPFMVQGIDGSKVEKVLELVHIAANKNTVPGDVSAMVPGGIRMETPSLTLRGFVEEDFVKVAEYFDAAVNLALKVKAKSKGS